jgi:copper chaperone NosL
MSGRKISPVLMLPLVWLLACRPAFEPVTYGKDACAHCRMTIMDPRFAAELIDGKGKVFKFDDVKCMRRFLSDSRLADHNTVLLIADYRQTAAAFLDARKAVFLQDTFFKSPMNGNCAAFGNISACREWRDSLELSVKTWFTIN